MNIEINKNKKVRAGKKKAQREEKCIGKQRTPNTKETIKKKIKKKEKKKRSKQKNQ